MLHVQLLAYLFTWLLTCLHVRALTHTAAATLESHVNFYPGRFRITRIAPATGVSTTYNVRRTSTTNHWGQITSQRVFIMRS